jgi:hypothetical protein
MNGLIAQQRAASSVWWDISSVEWVLWFGGLDRITWFSLLEYYKKTKLK